MHQKHSNIARASFGKFARNEVSFLGTPCSEIKVLFDKIVSNFSDKNFAIVEADHKAEEEIASFSSYVDKINFQRFDSKNTSNPFIYRTLFENVDLVLVNGNHFEAANQVVIIDSKKSLETKLHKLTNTQLIVTKEKEIPQFLLDHFGDKLPKIINWDNLDGLFNFIENTLIETIPPLFGLVLAGGKSTRMGTDKSLLKYHGNASQIEFGFNLLSQYCENSFLSVNESQAKNDQYYLPKIQDTFLGLGPMGGILSAFQKYPDSAWLTVACDMPFLSETSLNQLVVNRNPSKLATTFKSPMDEFPEPLITIWEPKAYPKLLQMLAFGYDCPRKTLINSDVELLIHSNETELQNINTKEEFEKAIIDLSPKIL